MKKVLIIGSKGMLGQELVRVFSALGGPASGGSQYEVIGWDVEDIDITEQAEVKEKIGALKPDIIVNAAAYNAVDKAEEPEEFVKAKALNGSAPGYLAQIAKKLGAVFVHYSSDYVFDGRKQEGYRENDLVSPISSYGRSKLLGEQEVKKAGGKYYIIRLQKLFGRPGQSENAKKSFFETMLFLAETKKELEVVDEELANFTYAPDLARQTKYIVENNLPSGIYHITNEGAPTTWFGAAKILFEMTQQRRPEPIGEGSIKDSSLRSRSAQNDNNNDLPILIPVSAEKFPRPAKRPKYSILLNTKLPPLRPWPEALKEFLNSR